MFSKTELKICRFFSLSINFLSNRYLTMSVKTAILEYNHTVLSQENNLGDEILLIFCYVTTLCL